MTPEEVWEVDYDKYHRAVLPFVVVDFDGTRWIDPECPPDLASGYRELLSIGLLNHWLRQA